MSGNTMPKLLVVAFVAVDLVLLIFVSALVQRQEHHDHLCFFFCLASAVFTVVMVLTWKLDIGTVKDHTKHRYNRGGPHSELFQLSPAVRSMVTARSRNHTAASLNCSGGTSPALP